MVPIIYPANITTFMQNYHAETRGRHEDNYGRSSQKGQAGHTLGNSQDCRVEGVNPAGGQISSSVSPVRSSHSSKSKDGLAANRNRASKSKAMPKSVIFLITMMLKCIFAKVPR